jgi:cytochrome P450
MSFADFVSTHRHHSDLSGLSPSHELGHELDRQADKDPHGFKGFVESLGTWAKEHPGRILEVIHHIRPVLIVKNVCIATGYEAARDILSRDGDFAVTYAPKMKMITEGANFFLGMDDDEPKGFSDRTNMQMLFRRDDVVTVVAPLIRSLCERRLVELKTQGQQFDLVKNYLKLIPAEFAIAYFGFRDIDSIWLNRVTQTLFEYLFIDVVNDPQLAQEAEAAAADLRTHLDAEIAAGHAGADTVLGRGAVLRKAGVAGFDPVNLRNNVIGLLIGLVPTIAKSAGMAFDYATRNSREDTTLNADFRACFARMDFAGFQAFVRELTRLNPINPGLFRQAARDTYVTSGGSNHKVSKGTLVFTGTFTGMRDKAFVPDPLRININRPDSAYLTYGYGLHACFGRFINDLHVAQLLYSLLESGDWTRVDGKEGDLVFDGAFPAHMRITL